jgi:ubiquinone/menaquinone biosynthesis C-methylase UbiE
MLDQARARSIATGRSLILVQADAARLPFGDASFDTVAISLALCTVPDPVATLLELARVCRPAGQIILLEHVRSPYRAIALGQGAITPLQERLIGCHLTRETIALARHLGFVIESERRRLFDIFRLVVAHPPQGAINPTHSRGKS